MGDKSGHFLVICPRSALGSIEERRVRRGFRGQVLGRLEKVAGGGGRGWVSIRVWDLEQWIE